jgi:hypothetical protein
MTGASRLAQPLSSAARLEARFTEFEASGRCQELLTNPFEAFQV